MWLFDNILSQFKIAYWLVFMELSIWKIEINL